MKIPNFSKYEILPDGRVLSLGKRKLQLKATIDRNGYHRFRLQADDGSKKSMYAHRMVALAYLPNPDNKPHVNHLDHDKANNVVENLNWCTHPENIKHDWASGKRKAPPRGEANWHNKHPKKLIDTLRRLFDSGEYTQSELSRKFNLPFPTVHVIVRRKQWRVES